MDSYERSKLLNEVTAIQVQLRDAVQHSRARNDLSERSSQEIYAGIKAMGGNLLDMAGSIAQITSSLDSHLPFIADHLSRSVGLLEEILNTVKNPTETMAYEYRRCGLDLFKKGWTEEAITEFKKSICAYGYDPSVHFALGYLLAGREETREAAESFARAAKYGLPGHHPLAVSASISAAKLFDAIQEGGRALEILAACQVAIPQAPDVAYELARRTLARDPLVAALSLRPSISLEARVEGLPEVEAAAREVLDYCPGFEKIHTDAVRSCNELAALLQRQGLPSPESIVPLPQVTSASAELAFFADQLPVTRARLSSAIREARAHAADMSRAAEGSMQEARVAQSRLREPDKPAEPNLEKTLMPRLALSGLLVILMAALVWAFQAHMAHIYETQNHSSGNAIDGLTGLLVWGGLLTSAGFCIATIPPALKTSRDNLRSRSQQQARLSDYRKHVSAYQTECNKAAKLRTKAEEAAIKSAAFSSQVSSLVESAEQIRQRLEWSTVEPITIHSPTAQKVVGAH